MIIELTMQPKERIKESILFAKRLKIFRHNFRTAPAQIRKYFDLIFKLPIYPN